MALRADIGQAGPVRMGQVAQFGSGSDPYRDSLPVVDFIVPVGQVLIGAALILGLGTRFAAVMGFLMMGFITIAAWDFAHGPINYTGFLALTTLMVGVLRAGEVYGIDAIVDEQPIVKRTPALRYVLG